MKLKYSAQLIIFVITGLFLMFTNSCKKDTKIIPSETGTVTDVEGNVYKTIKIGNQWWMAENLRVTKYNDQTAITKILLNATPVAFDTTWANKKTGACCIFDNNNEFGKTYGLLYNWYAVNDNKKIAPDGWHIPTDDEWKKLEKQLGMSASETEKTSWRGTHEGEKLKTLKIEISGEDAWTKTGDIWATNESGFTALAGGCCMFDGRWGDPGIKSTGFWWSISTNGNDAWYRHLDYKNANVFRYYGPKTYGFSVRCVMN